MTALEGCNSHWKRVLILYTVRVWLLSYLNAWDLKYVRNKREVVGSDKIIQQNHRTSKDSWSSSLRDLWEIDDVARRPSAVHMFPFNNLFSEEDPKKVYTKNQ